MKRIALILAAWFGVALPTLAGIPPIPAPAPGQALLAPAYVSGNWYAPPFVTAATGSAMSSGFVQCAPQIALVPIKVQALGARINTAGSSNIQLALYANSGGYPSGAALGSTGNIVDTSTGMISGTVTPFTLPAGMYWACANANDSTVVFQSNNSSNSLSASGLVGNPTLANLSAASTAVLLVIQQSATFGTWPTLSSSGWSVTSSGHNPIIYLQGQ